LGIIFIAIVVIGGLLDWRDQFEALDKAQASEAKLKEENASKKARAVNLELYVQQLKEIEQSFGGLLTQLPNKTEMDALLTYTKPGSAEGCNSSCSSQPRRSGWPTSTPSFRST